MFCEERPLVSVIMGTRYRREDTGLLKRALRSILDQTYRDIEFLVCENGSTNVAKVCLADYAARDGRVRLIGGEGADTLSEKLNRCIAEAKGSYIARMDDDDFSHPDRLEKQVDYLRGHEDISFVGCAVELERDGRPMGCRTFPERPKIDDFLMVQPFIHSALMFRREALEAVGGYCPAEWCAGCEDYELLLRMYEAGYVGANMGQALLTYTLPPSGQENRTMKMRAHEVKTRFVRFHTLGLLPGKLPYVVKPIAAGLVPRALRERIKRRRWERAGY